MDDKKTDVKEAAQKAKAMVSTELKNTDKESTLFLME